MQQGEHKREIMSKQSVCSVHIAGCDIRRIICVRRPPPPPPLQNVVEPLSGWAVCLGCAVALGSVGKDNERSMTGRVYRRTVEFQSNCKQVLPDGALTLGGKAESKSEFPPDAWPD